MLGFLYNFFEIYLPKHFRYINIIAYKYVYKKRFKDNEAFSNWIKGVLLIIAFFLFLISDRILIPIGAEKIANEYKIMASILYLQRFMFYFLIK